MQNVNTRAAFLKHNLIKVIDSQDEAFVAVIEMSAKPISPLNHIHGSIGHGSHAVLKRY